MLSAIEIAAIFIVIIVLIIIVIICWFFFYKRVMNRIPRSNILSKEECKNFFKGVHYTDVEEKDTNLIGRLERIGYDKKLEVPQANFKIDTLTVLDTGFYGNVCQGEVTLAKKPIKVAVKMTNQLNPKLALTGLMREIKVLSYLGNHENIVKLIGAHTSELRLGKLYVFLEYCQGGTLEAHLKSYNSKYTLTQDNLATPKPCNIEDISPYTLTDLYLWSWEIANGMEFLASKKVVKANLCTRNIVLGNYNKAKISGFEVANRHESYTYYSEQQQGDLAWRWAAPETLRRLAFNERTDVWSYGVTVWEIYTLGELPYSDILGIEELLPQLLDGRRLLEPPLVKNITLYDDVMLKCFDSNPNKRPTFKDTVEILRNVTGKNAED